MNEQRLAHDKRKKDLSRELEVVLKAAMARRPLPKDSLSADVTQNLCNIVEAIFIHGLRDPFFLRGSRYAKYPEPNFWPFVSKFSHRAVITQIVALSQIKSEIGKGRAWIRLIMNENSIEHYLMLLLNETNAVRQFYSDDAFIRDEEHVERAKDMLKGLNGIRISAPTNSALLNSWTPTPLILAGLVAGKPIQVPPPRRPAPPPTDETGISALDLLADMPSPMRRSKNSRDDLLHQSDDDASSVYSHPSMVEERPPSRLMLDGVLTGDLPSSYSQLLVQRRTKRRRNQSKSSSDGSHSQSGKEKKETIKETSEESAAATTTEVVIPPTTTSTHTREGMDSGVDVEPENSNNQGNASSLAEEMRTTLLEELQQGDDEVFVEEEKKPEPEDIEPTTSSTMEKTKEEKEVEKVEEEEEEEIVSPVPTSLEESTLEEGEISTVATEVPEASFSNATFETDECNETRDADADASESGYNEEAVLRRMSEMQYDESPSGNSLIGRSWRLSVRSEFGDSSGVLSTSTDSSSAPISFGQALRKHCDANEIDASEDSDGLGASLSSGGVEEHDEEERKRVEEKEMVERLTRVAHECGLDQQDFRCPMCKATIGPPTYRGYNVCSLDARYYCQECWAQGAEYVIPARIILNWDTRPRKVSARSRAFLETVGDKPILHLDRLNPSIYEHSATMKETKELREKLQLVSMYLFTCRESVADDLRKRVFPKEYLIDDIHLYSYNDLLAVISGAMQRQLRGLLKHAIGHVFSCALCAPKGFVCEFCNDARVIYPFQTETTHRCSVCFAVFHSTCAADKECVKCVRRQLYATSHQADHLALECDY